MKSDLIHIFELLQQISSFFPDDDHYSECYENFITNNCYGIVAEHDGHVIGFGSIAFVPRIRGGVTGYIEDISVNSEFKRKGIGSMIVCELIRYAKNYGCYKVSLESKEINLDFYKSLGFINSGFVLNKYFLNK